MTFQIQYIISYSFFRYLRPNSTSEKESLLDDCSPSESKRKSDQISEKEGLLAKDTKSVNANNKAMTIQSSHGDIKHISGTLNSDDLYALPNKRKQPQNRDDGQVYEIGSDEEGNSNGKDDDDYDEEKGKKDSIDGIEDKDRNKDLPFGWEKHEGNVHVNTLKKTTKKKYTVLFFFPATTLSNADNLLSYDILLESFGTEGNGVGKEREVSGGRQSNGFARKRQKKKKRRECMFNNLGIFIRLIYRVICFHNIFSVFFFFFSSFRAYRATFFCQTQALFSIKMCILFHHFLVLFFFGIDNDGPYYWHIKSGTIQREPPLWPKNQAEAKELKTPVTCLNPTSQFLRQSSTKSPNNTNPLTQLFGSKSDVTGLGGSTSNRLQVIV